jgi:hypothetical protein
MVQSVHTSLFDPEPYLRNLFMRFNPQKCNAPDIRGIFSRLRGYSLISEFGL